MVSSEQQDLKGRRRKRLSRHKKKSWHLVNINDVEEYLDDQRLQERLGGPFTKKEDNELFLVDLGGEDAKKEKTPHQKSTAGELVLEDGTSRQKPIQRKKRKELKPLKCFRILNVRSAVPDPVKNRKTLKTAEEREKKATKGARFTGKLQLKEINAYNQRVRAALRRKRLLEKKKVLIDPSDIWNKTESDCVLEGLNNDWLQDDVKTHLMAQVGKKVMRKPKTLSQKPSAVPAVEPPHPGISYNPSIEDHSSLLHKAGRIEYRKIKKEKHLDFVTKPIFTKISEKESNERFLKEMLSGIFKEEGHVSEPEEEEDDLKSANPSVTGEERKTLKQRKKQAKEKVRQEKILRSRSGKETIAEIEKSRLIRKELETREKTHALEVAKKTEKKAEIEKVRTKRLSKTKYEAPDVDMNFSNELSGNLRSIKVGGNLLCDRLKSFQKRNIIEPEPRAKSKKKTRPTRKVYVRKSHKMVNELPLPH